MVNQFVLNTGPQYPTPADSTPTGYTLSGPQSGLGWRGAYLSTPGTDPWGKVYLANTVFLVVATDATTGSAEGNAQGGWSRDTFVISAGPNGAFDTPFEWKGTEVRCGASLGVSLYPDHARDPAALLASADEAMYREKTSG